jgi:hypothetical protein
LGAPRRKGAWSRGGELKLRERTMPHVLIEKNRHDEIVAAVEVTKDEFTKGRK